MNKTVAIALAVVLMAGVLSSALQGAGRPKPIERVADLEKEVALLKKQLRDLEKTVASLKGVVEKLQASRTSGGTPADPEAADAPAQSDAERDEAIKKRFQKAGMKVLGIWRGTGSKKTGLVKTSKSVWSVQFVRIPNPKLTVEGLAMLNIYVEAADGRNVQTITAGRDKQGDSTIHEGGAFRLQISAANCSWMVYAVESE